MGSTSEIKQMLTALALKPVVASSYGLGLATTIDRTSWMTPTEQRYAQIEKEALARFSDYLDFLIQTDHKPLVPLFSVKALPIRVQRFRMRMLRYRFNIEHIPGKDLRRQASQRRKTNSWTKKEMLTYRQPQTRCLKKSNKSRS